MRAKFRFLSRPPTLSIALLLLGWAILAFALIAESRRPGPEATVRLYFENLESRSGEAALGALTPVAAEKWRDFVEFQQFNDYEIVSAAARSPSLLESLAAGLPWQATQLTLVVDVREPSGVRWRASTLVPVAYVDGRWVLIRPPFAPGK